MLIQPNSVRSTSKLFDYRGMTRSRYKAKVIICEGVWAAQRPQRGCGRSRPQSTMIAKAESNIEERASAARNRTQPRDHRGRHARDRRRPLPINVSPASRWSSRPMSSPTATTRSRVCCCIARIAIRNGATLPMAALVNDRWRGEFAVSAAGTLPLHPAGLGRSLQILVARSGQACRGQPGCHGRSADRRRAGRGGRRRAPRGDDAGRLEQYAEALRAGGAEGARLALSAELAELMYRHAERLFASTYDQELEIAVDRERARFGAWYELFPRSCAPEPGSTARSRMSRSGWLMSPPWASTCSTCRRSTRSAVRSARAATIPPTAGPDDPGSPWAIGAAEGGHKAIHPRARHAGGFPAPGAARRRVRHRAGAGYRLSVRARSPLCQRAPRVVPRSGPMARSSTPRTRPRSTRTSTRSISRRRALAGAVGRAEERGAVLDRPGRAHLPRRQPAHQAVPVLGMADRRDQAGLSRDDLSGRGVHAPEGDVPAGQARLHPVVQLLPLAQHQAGADRVPDRADPDRGARVLWREPLAEYARHPARVSSSMAGGPLHDPAVLAATLGASYGIYGAGLRAVR